MDLGHFRDVGERVAAAAARSNRAPEEVTLVAVSKGQSVDAITALYRSGHRDFGENRAQEMAEKAAQLPADIRWHFVGTLQSNKVRMVRNITWLLHSVDRASLAKAWIKGIGAPPPILIQVDVGDEEQKGGVNPEGLQQLWERCAEIKLDVQGLMTIPPQSDHPEGSRRYFAALRAVGENLAVKTDSDLVLSMGMTDDFEIAIEEGASMIRVGRAIFGPRLLQD